ncbi:MAG TPA: hypothetical protein VMT30_01105 [Candidatus Saccharimonadia bacterium]|nr:hypothetical protein [Candidatus Saccharimonadia bacterium]
MQRGAFGSEKHIDALKNNPQAALGHELGEAEETWKSVLDFVGYYQRDGKDAIVEGVAILPEQLSKVDFEFKSVFIANLADQTEDILAHARKNPNDWLRKYDEETIRLYASFNQLWNKFYADEARKYGFPVIEIESGNFHASIEKAARLLVA